MRYFKLSCLAYRNDLNKMPWNLAQIPQSGFNSMHTSDLVPRLVQSTNITQNISSNQYCDSDYLLGLNCNGAKETVPQPLLQSEWYSILCQDSSKTWGDILSVNAHIILLISLKDRGPALTLMHKTVNAVLGESPSKGPVISEDFSKASLNTFGLEHLSRSSYSPSPPAFQLFLNYLSAQAGLSFNSQNYFLTLWFSLLASPGFLICALLVKFLFQGPFSLAAFPAGHWMPFHSGILQFGISSVNKVFWHETEYNWHLELKQNKLIWTR